MNTEGLSPTTRNILAITSHIPFILLKRDPGSARADRVFRELLSISGEELMVCEHDQGVILFRKSSARQFIV